MNTKKLEYRVGFFIFVAILILSIMVLSLGRQAFFRPGYRIKVHFNFISGIGVGVPVRLAGAEVGRVDDIRIIYADDKKTKVEVTLWLTGETRIRSDSVVNILMLGLLGEKYIEITPGQSGEFIREGSPALIGKDPLPLEEIGDLATELGLKLDKALDIFSNTFGDIETQEDFKGMLSNSRKLIQNMNEVVLENRENITEIIANLKNTSNKIDQAAGTANQLIEKINNKEGTLGQLINDDTLYYDITEIVANLKNTSNKINQTVSTVNQLVEKIDNKEGTLGRLIGDDTLYYDINELIADVKKHPWKLFRRTPRPRTLDKDISEGNRGYIHIKKQ